LLAIPTLDGINLPGKRVKACPFALLDEQLKLKVGTALGYRPFDQVYLCPDVSWIDQAHESHPL
jgi:hypothetical protein